jgi:hypothetical protein
VEPEAINDLTGTHLKAENIYMPDFLAKQIAQRIAALLQEDNYKKYFKIEKSEGKYEGKKFVFEYSLTKISEPKNPVDYKQEILHTIAYCVKTYEFKDFSEVEINDAMDQSKIILSMQAIWAINPQ